jgi:hypothetical protein
VPAELLQQVYDIAKMVATSMNTQPARYVFLNASESRQRLMPALSPGNVEKTKLAPVTVIVASDMRFYENMPAIWHKPGAQEIAYKEDSEEGQQTMIIVGPAPIKVSQHHPDSYYQPHANTAKIGGHKVVGRAAREAGREQVTEAGEQQ